MTIDNTVLELLARDTTYMTIEDMQKKLRANKRWYTVYGVGVLACFAVWVAWAFSLVPGRAIIVSIPLVIVFGALASVSAKSVTALHMIIGDRETIAADQVEDVDKK